MASENNNDSFQVFGILVNNDDYNTKHLPEQYKTLIENYIGNRHSTMKEIIKNYSSKTNLSLFTVIKFFQEDTDDQQYWINLNIVKFNGKLFGFIMDPSESSVSENEQIAKLKNIITEMISENIEFINYSNQDESYIRLKNIEIALSNMEILINFLSNETEEITKKKFQQLKFFQKNNQSIKFEKLIVELGLNMRFNFKSTLKKILSVFKSLLDTDSEYQLPEENQLKMLSNTLISSNFVPRGNEQDDLIKDVISLLILLKARKQKFFNEKINENIKTYFEKNRDKYQKQINEFNKKLQDDSREKTIQDRLGLFLKYRIEYLVNINKLNSDLKSLKEIDEFMKFFDYKTKQEELEIRRNKLENDSKKILVEDDSIRIKDELSDIRKELVYYDRISEIFNELNFEDLIIVLGTFDSTEFFLSNETIIIILELGLTTENNEIASAIIKILNFNKTFLFNYDQKMTEVFDNIVPQIPLEEIDIVLEVSKTLKIINNPTILKFLYKILIESENSERREKAFENLVSLNIDSENLKYINETIQLERKCREKSQNIVKECLEHVRIRNQLTMNCFEKLKDYFDSKEISEIIEIILEKDLQKLPKFFIEKFRQYMQLASSNQINIIRISKLLIKYKQIKFDNLKNIEKFIDNHETIGNDIFEILRYEYEHGRQLPADVHDRIRNAGKTNVYAKNLINLIEETPSNIDLLENTKNRIEIRKNALKNLLEDQQNHTLETFQFLESLVKYDSNLSVEAFKILIRITPNNFQFNLIEIEKFLGDNSNLSIDDLTHFIQTDKINETFIGILPLLINRIEDPKISIDDNNRLMELLNRISNVKQNELFIIDQRAYFFYIIFNTTNHKLRENILQIIKNSINETTQKNSKIFKHQTDGTIIESYLIDELKTFDSLHRIEISVESLKNLKENIQQGFVISEDTINFLIDNLLKLNKNQQDLRLIINEILFEIEHRQSLDIKHIHQIIQNSELLTFTHIIGIIANASSRNIELPKEIIDNLSKQLLSNNDPLLTNYFISITLAIVNQKESLSIDVIQKIAGLLIIENQSTEAKIICSQILLKNFKQNFNYSDTIRTIMDSLKEFVLKSRENSNDDLLNKLYFEVLEKSIEENQDDHQFLQQYYNQFKTRLINMDHLQDVDKGKFLKELKPLDEFISKNNLNDKNCSNLKKFQLLCSLNNALINYKIIDTNIFKEFSSNEWDKEILCTELLFGTFQLIIPDDGINEFELENFRNYIHFINDYLSTLKDNIYSIENLLKILIDKQYIYQIGLKIINDILLMLSESNSIESLNLVENDQDYQISFIQLRQFLEYI
ncbi:unnamed protein product [Rotaria socialis]|uniref:Uncharacterized protein n=1 Tax=Rotaria socialis TaxID=392032 RepID=A0A818VD79_9BILA|nr:unnamed protein product [Rotaria socialis]CAF4844983.1 unnamed protein product [Rotaria socialis]